MGISLSLLLVAAGAILAFALNVRVSGVDLHAVGWILMVVGVLGLIVTVILWDNRRRRLVRTEPTGYRQVVEREDVGPPEPM